MVSAETLLNYPDWKIPSTAHIHASDKQLGVVINHNSKSIGFFSRELRNPQCNFTTTEKKLLVIMEYLKQFRGILFGYKINVFSDNKNLLYVATLNESKKVMSWQLILEEFGTNIRHIYGVEK